MAMPKNPAANPDRFECASGDLTFVNVNHRDGFLWVTVHNVAGQSLHVQLSESTASEFEQAVYLAMFDLEDHNHPDAYQPIEFDVDGEAIEMGVL